MKKNLLDLSKRLDSVTLDIFQSIAICATRLNISFFIVGATARDIIFTNIYDIPTVRATADIDFGVMLENWQHYHQLTKALIATQKIEPTKTIHRFIYKQMIEIDVIPFGAIGGQDASILWPPNDEIKMNILGFKEAYQDALSIKVQSNPECYIKLASLAGLALLKIISWHDRGYEDSRDAEDLALIMSRYLDAGNTERMFEKAADLIEDDFDYEQASARLLGRDIAKILTPSLKDFIIEILNQETNADYRLITNMMKNTQVFTDDDFEKNLRLVENLKKGIQDIIRAP